MNWKGCEWKWSCPNIGIIMEFTEGLGKTMKEQVKITGNLAKI
jgi:hypothetical protein